MEAPRIIGNVTDYNFAIRPKDLVNFSYSSSFRSITPILTDTDAAVSSSLGIVTGFREATRDLAIAREQ